MFVIRKPNGYAFDRIYLIWKYKLKIFSTAKIIIIWSVIWGMHFVQAIVEKW